MLEKTLESPLDCKEIKPVNPKGNQPWIFTGRTDAETEAPISWPPDVKNWLIGKDPDAGKDWRQEEKGTTEDEMVGCHHWLNEHEFEQALGDGEGQRSLARSSPWVCRESDMTEQLNNNKGCKDFNCNKGYNWSDLAHTCLMIINSMLAPWLQIPIRVCTLSPPAHTTEKVALHRTPIVSPVQCLLQPIM